MLRDGRNVLISGGTGSGKTTLLNALVALLPPEGRVVSIEDTLELRLRRANGLRFEARGLGDRGVTIGDLVRHALRHRPDHIVVGEVRGAEAADLLQALNTGHDGPLVTDVETVPPGAELVRDLDAGLLGSHEASQVSRTRSVRARKGER